MITNQQALSEWANVVRDVPGFDIAPLAVDVHLSRFDKAERDRLTLALFRDHAFTFIEEHCAEYIHQKARRHHFDLYFNRKNAAGKEYYGCESVTADTLDEALQKAIRAAGERK